MATTPVSNNKRNYSGIDVSTPDAKRRNASLSLAVRLVFDAEVTVVSGSPWSLSLQAPVEPSSTTAQVQTLNQWHIKSDGAVHFVRDGAAGHTSVIKACIGRRIQTNNSVYDLGTVDKTVDAVLTRVGVVLDADAPLSKKTVPALLYAERIAYGNAKYAALAAVASMRALATALGEVDRTAALFGDIESRLSSLGVAVDE